MLSILASASPSSSKTSSVVSRTIVTSDGSESS
jgi:hypothetical protein